MKTKTRFKDNGDGAAVSEITTMKHALKQLEKHEAKLRKIADELEDLQADINERAECAKDAADNLLYAIDRLREFG